MATQIDNTFRSLSFASAISANTLVRISGDNAGAALVTAGEAVGVTQEDVAATGVGAVKLFGPTQFGIVSPGPVTAGSNVFATTGGVIVGTLVTSGLTLGTAINSGTTGDIVEYAVKL
jgi:sarcosine oxidase gamma subunit